MLVVVRKLVLVQIHWFSIINSCVTVLLLTGFLATILMRVLKNDFVKYTRDDEAGELVSACCLLDAQGHLRLPQPHRCAIPFVHLQIAKASCAKHASLPHMGEKLLRV